MLNIDLRLSIKSGYRWSRASVFPVILQYAIKANAAAVILAHNHLSGNLVASEADIRITKTVKEALKLMDIELLDHLILTYEEKYSTIETDRLGSAEYADLTYMLQHCNLQ